ncbi:glycosyltransferase family 1 protein [Caulobacter sp. 602-2]|uniref:Glycosyltransferase family 1 protein n=1 Tax=Caulobacter sp. 602-2 TaxID=2710887 RepID=A0A6G4QRM7_9CAUL|nr:glycosyltransferase [Caulobacter sp. 602-2]NGM48089.1 glycosyltransferase family 1 protein [Caulobacter sp. 602-2]
MARFLFTTWEGGGHVQPLLLVAADMIARGHEVLAISDPANAADAQALGVPFRAWTSAPFQTGKTRDDDRLRDFEADNPMAVIERLLDRVMTGPSAAYAHDVLGALDDFPADVIVTQELLLGVMVAAQARGTRLALLSANIWSLPNLAGAPPFGAGMAPAADDQERSMHAMVAQMARGLFQSGLPALNAARAEHGLAPLDDLFAQFDAADAILLATSAAFDFAPDPLPAPFAHVGPYLADPAWARPAPLPDGDAPLVVVSFSSLYQAQEQTLRNVIAALSGLPVRALVTTGPTLDPAEFEAPPHVKVVRSAPHGAVLGQAAAFITHAGHGSTLRPLMAGVPLLCLPMGRDQNDNAIRAAHRGAAITLSPDASPEKIAHALGQLLDDPSYGQAARTLGARIARDAEGRSAARALEALV